MAKRKPTKTQQLRKLVQQQVRRMEKRGYRIDSATKEKIKTGNYQSLQSIRKNRYAKLYNASSAEIDSKIVGGKEYRKYERKQSAEKGLRTRRYHEQVNRIYDEARRSREEAERSAISEEENAYHGQDYYDQEDYERDWEEQHTREELEWEEKRREQDRFDRQTAQYYQEGEIAYNEIERLIDKYPTKGAEFLKQALSNEVGRFGKEAVIAGLSTMPQEAIETVQNICRYNEDASTIHAEIVDFFSLITGTILSAQEAMELGEVMDDMTDFEEY